VSNQRDAVIQSDMAIKGRILGGRRIDLHGYLEGHVEAETVVVHAGGRLFGTMMAGVAEVRGNFQGEAVVKSLISIGSGGSVNGNLRYGRIAMEPGAELSADVRNIPPEITGDMHVVVRRGKQVALTTLDVAALDPDDVAQKLVFTVGEVKGGWLVLAKDLAQAVSEFTQSDLAAGNVIFRHDGSTGTTASFDVTVTDAKGATSGAPRSITVAVTG
jgi:cytoskeletal protein CcmA (bactofilin family)